MFCFHFGHLKAKFKVLTAHMALVSVEIKSRNLGVEEVCKDKIIACILLIVSFSLQHFHFHKNGLTPLRGQGCV